MVWNKPCVNNWPQEFEHNVDYAIYVQSVDYQNNHIGKIFL